MFGCATSDCCAAGWKVSEMSMIIVPNAKGASGCAKTAVAKKPMRHAQRRSVVRRTTSVPKQACANTRHDECAVGDTCTSDAQWGQQSACQPGLLSVFAKAQTCRDRLPHAAGGGPSTGEYIVEESDVTDT